MPTPQEELDAFEAETAAFHRPGNAPPPPTPEDLAKASADTQDDDGKGSADDDAEKDVDKAAEGDKENTEADKAKEGEEGEESDEKVAAEGDDDEPPKKEADVPAWLGKRSQRLRARESAAQQQVREANERAQRAEEEAAELRRQIEGGGDKGKELKKPRAEDFDEVDDYEKARDEFEEQEARKKAKPPAPEKKATDTQPQPPLGITWDELGAAVRDLDTTLPPTVAARLKDEKQVKALPAPVLMHLADEEDAGTKASMARFVIGNPKIMQEIARLPPLKQAAAFVRAFDEVGVSAPRLKSKAPQPGDRLNNARGGGNSPNLSEMSFREFDEHMTALERKEGRRSY